MIHGKWADYGRKKMIKIWKIIIIAHAACRPSSSQLMGKVKLKLGKPVMVQCRKI